LFTILKKRNLAPNVEAFQIQAPQIAQKARPGHFVVIRLHLKGERIPLTIADWDRAAGTIMIVCQTFGKTSFLLNQMEEGEKILDLLGPLGTPIEVKNYGTVVLVGGGVGVPAILPKAKELKKAGNKVLSIIGAQRRELLLLGEEMAQNSHKVYFTTDDGSFGKKGLVTDVLQELINSQKIDLVISVGPVPMMRATVNLTRENKIPSIVSLNPIMVDGTGMCGCCRVSISGQTKFACVDGPAFDGDTVDFDELIARQRFFHEEEAQAREEVHRCQCGK
jgi:ferredoxin--NADP+ reductase